MGNFPLNDQEGQSLSTFLVRRTLLYDTSYEWISIVASGTRRELASLGATSPHSETAISPIKMPAAKEAVGYGKISKKARSPKKVLRIPDLEHSKQAVINSLPAKASQESYEYAINEFISWYCSEPRLAFNRTAVAVSVPQRHPKHSVVFVFLRQTDFTYLAADTSGVEAGNFGKLGLLPRADYERFAATPVEWLQRDDGLRGHGGLGSVTPCMSH